jgi:hypothetical protein
MSIYFAADSNGSVKIGRARDVERRLRSLETSHTEALRLLRVVDGGPATERWLHRKFAAQRIRGEWFSYCPEMMTVRPPDEIPPKPKQIVQYKTARAYLLACDGLGLLDPEMRRTYGLPGAKE